MPQDINQTRYRTLVIVLGLAFFLCLGAASIAWLRQDTHPLSLVGYVAAALINLGLIPVAMRARRELDRRLLERLALAAIVVGFLALLQRLLWYVLVYWVERPDANPFRTMFQFLPFFFVAVAVLLQSRRALLMCWAAWGIVAGLILFGLWHAGITFRTEGTLPLLLWLLVANPMFIMLLHALPRYESALAENERELANLRERTELMDKLSESERRFNLVVEGLEVGVWDRWIGDSPRRWWSPRFYELVGYTPDELPPTEDALQSLMHPEDREVMWHKGTEQLKEGDTLDVVFRMRTKHRGYRWFNARAKALRDANGRLVRLAGSIADIHENHSAAEALRTAQAELTRLAYRDTLTDLYNRRYFDEHFQREWERARRGRQPLALLLVDLDHFKAYNDRYGHPMGDTCLVEVAKRLSRCANRPADIVARLGGEEFGIVLPGTTALGAEEVAHRMLAQLQTGVLPHEDAPDGRVTVSVGIAAIEEPDGPGPAELFEQADKALYEAKRRGRNGIVRWAKDAPAAAQPQLWSVDKKTA